MWTCSPPLLIMTQLKPTRAEVTASQALWEQPRSTAWRESPARSQLLPVAISWLKPEMSTAFHLICGFLASLLFFSNLPFVLHPFPSCHLFTFCCYCFPSSALLSPNQTMSPTPTSVLSRPSKLPQTLKDTYWLKTQCAGWKWHTQPVFRLATFNRSQEDTLVMRAKWVNI